MSMTTINNLRVKIFADGADKAGILKLYELPYIQGFTTNPTLMRRAGIANYEAFAREVLAAVPDRPISFEVIADEFAEMERQARIVASWGQNVYVKIPVTNTRGEPSLELVRRLSHGGVKVNVTAIMTVEQVRSVAEALRGGQASYISVFAGRVADTGRDPLPLMTEALEAARVAPKAEMIWASARELLNLFHADSIGCHVITLTHAILKQLSLVGKNLDEYSLDTVKMFYEDARNAGYSI
jgi:transaldolase